MTAMVERFVAVDSGRVRILTNGTARRETVVFLHGGVPGVTPYCGGAHVWGGVLDQFARDCNVVAFDLPGCGGTVVRAEDALTPNGMALCIAATMSRLGLRQCHIVGHDLGGLIALELAMQDPSLIATLSVVASAWASPSGDGVENVTLAAPLVPLWGRQSQLWALDRLSYAHHHIDDHLMSACMVAAQSEGHRQARDIMDRGFYADAFIPGVMKTKSRLYSLCREAALGVPVQVIWAAQDPMTTSDQGFWLFRIVAQHQMAAQYHLINRSGSFVFREQRERFHEVVAAFQQGLAGAA